MFLLYTLSILGKSIDYAIDFAKSDYDLFLNSSGVFIRQLNENAENAIVYESTNVKDFTVHLNISLSFDESKKEHLLNIIVDPMKVNLDLEIKCLNQDILHPGIKVHDKIENEDEYFNYYTITIHSDTIFYYDMKDWSIGTIESYSLNNKLTTRVLLSEYKSFYGSYSYICYKSTDCFQDNKMGPYDSYFIAPDDTILNLFIEDVYVDEYDKSFYILFDKSGDFPVINNKIEGKNVHLMGISDELVELKITNEINIDQIVLSNVKFVKKNQDEELNLNFETIFIEDDTPDVFPTDKCTITCNNFYQYITKADTPQYESIIVSVKKGFYILPDFENNGDLTLKLSDKNIEVKNAKDELLATIPVYESYSKTAIHIENQKNLNYNKIVIRNEFNNLEENLKGSFDINLENCGQIPIDFVNWNDEKLSEFTINIYNDLIYDEIVTNIDSPYLKYTYNTGENVEESTFSFPEDATKVVLCLFADTCSHPEIAGNDVYQHPINGADITAINSAISNFMKEKTNIVKLFLVLNDNVKSQELSLPEKIDKLKFLSFIYNGKDETPTTITLSAFPTNTDETQIDLEIIKCSLAINSGVQGGKLFVSGNGEINGEGVKFEPKIDERNVILSSTDEKINLKDVNILKLVVESGEDPHNIIFESYDNCDCTIYIQYKDRNYFDIPISFSVAESTKSSNKLQIRTINNERIVFKSIPTNVEITVKFDDTEVVQYYIPAQSDKVSICYNNILCKQNDKELTANEMYLSSSNEKYFASLIDLLKQNDYEYIRLIFQNNRDYEDVDFSKITDKVKQIQLTSYGDNDKDAYLILNSNMENKNIQSWLFEPNVFFWRSNDEKLFNFNEISFNSADEEYILEMLDNMYENYYIETFHLPLEYASSVYNYLVDSNLILNFGKIYIDIEPENGELYLECTDYNLILNDKSNTIHYSDLSSLYLQILDDNSDNKQVVKINITDDTIDKVNLIIAKKAGSVSIDFICSEDSENSNFELNLSFINHIDVVVNKNRCNIDSSACMESKSGTFEFQSDGCHVQNQDNPINSIINRIIFNQQRITISEVGGYNASETFYFVSSAEAPVITIKENVKNTKIGVVSNKSPTVILEKKEYPLSFMNTYDNQIDIDITDDPEESNTKLVFDKVDNQQGQFLLNIPSSIRSVSFSEIIMSKASTFEVNLKEESSSIKLLSNDEKTINVRDSVVISPESDSKIKNLELNGTLYIDDDSTLKLNGNTVFLDDSIINLNAKNAINGNERNNYIIECANSLETVPSSINVFIKNDGKININDLKIIGPFESKEICDSLGSKINFGDGKQVSYSNNCIEDKGKYVLSMSAKDKEKEKKKLSAGAIAGIVIACVVVVAIIIGIIVYCAKRKINIVISSKDNEDDSCAF